MHLWLIRVLRWMDVRLLYAFTAVFVVPVCLVMNESRGIIYRYFRQRHGYGRWRAAWKTYTNHCLFSQAVIDKFAMYAGKRFHIDIEGYEHFQRLAQRPEGFLQLSSHIGNYEIAGYTLVAEKTLHALVYHGEKQSVMNNRNAMFAHTNIRMIPVSTDMSHLFLIEQALHDGQIVSMPADRLFGSQKTVTVSLLGAEAPLPMGPFSVATMHGLDVLSVHVIKTGLTRYRIYVTPLFYDRQAVRSEQVRQLAASYAAELERMLTRYPAQWYNFFDFWKQKS